MVRHSNDEKMMMRSSRKRKVRFATRVKMIHSRLDQIVDEGGLGLRRLPDLPSSLSTSPLNGGGGMG